MCDGCVLVHVQTIYRPSHHCPSLLPPARVHTLPHIHDVIRCISLYGNEQIISGGKDRKIGNITNKVHVMAL